MSESILIVDDNIDNLDVLQILLEDDGFDVRIAVDAAQALDILRTFQPNLILMDIQLPGMDGLELTRRLRQNSSLDGAVIVAVSAYAMTRDEDNARAAGCEGYITKPIDTRTFVSIIRKHLATSRESILYGGALMDTTTRIPTDAAKLLVHPPQGIPLKMIERFLSRCRSRVGSLSAILERGDFEAAQVFGHRLKGSGGTYGISRLSEIGSLIEIAAADLDSVQLKSLVVVLNTYLSRLEVVA